METNFQHKFEYTDFLIELTIVKNYLKTIYAKKLKELNEFKAKLSILKKDIIFLNSIINNEENDFYVFLDKLENIVSISKINNLENDDKDIIDIEGDIHLHKRRYDNLEQNQDSYEKFKNKKVKLDHVTEMLLDWENDDKDMNLNDFNSPKKSYLNYDNVKSIIAKVLNEKVMGESMIKELIIEIYDKIFSKENDIKENSYINNDNDNDNDNDNYDGDDDDQDSNDSNLDNKITPKFNPVRSATTSYGTNSNHAHSKIVEPVYLDVNFSYVDSADECSSTSSSDSILVNDSINGMSIPSSNSLDNNKSGKLKNHETETGNIIESESTIELKKVNHSSGITNKNDSFQATSSKSNNNIDSIDNTNSNTNYKLKNIDNTNDPGKGIYL